MTLVKAFNRNPKIKFVGIRPGEKLHEEMISISEGVNTVDLKNYYAILNEYSKKKKKYKNSTYVKENFYYNSGENLNFLSVPELKKLIKTEL